MQFVPYLAAIACLIRIFSLPRGKDLVVPIALIPWWALDVEFGVSLKVSEFLMLVVVTRHFCASSFSYGSFPGRLTFATYILFSLLMAIVTIEFGPEVPEFAGGSVMRNGYGRVATTMIKTFIVFGLIACLVSSRKKVDATLLLSSYVSSCYVLAILGAVQLLVFVGAGVDLFPISMFQGSEYARSGVVSINGSNFIRVSSLGGEPKGFGQALAVALCLHFVFRAQFKLPKFIWRVRGLLMLFVLVMTSSTSAYITVLVAGGFLYLFSRYPRPFQRWQVNCVLTGTAALVVGLFFGLAVFTDTLAPPKYRTMTSFADNMLYKVTDRIKLDDTDSIIMESLVDDPAGLILGRGLGVSHHYSYKFIPWFNQFYLKGQLIVPKSGTAEIISNAGLIGVALIIATISGFIPAPAKGRRSSLSRSEITGMQSLGFGLFATLLLRLYCYEVIWVVYSCMYVLNRQRATATSVSRAKPVAGKIGSKEAAVLVGDAA